MIRFQLFARLLAAAGLVLLACSAKGGVAAKYPEPEDGAVENRVFQDDYFGIRYPLPSGWVEDLKGPEPSPSGYYSLAALKPEGELVATIQISAQDNFFAPEPVKDAVSFLNAMKQGLDPSLSAPHAVASFKVGLDFARLDYSGAGLNHAVFATEIRCHTLIFSITASREALAEMLVESLKKMSFTQADHSIPSSQVETFQGGWPLCVSESAYSDHIVHRVEPVMAGPRYASVPVRLIVGADGKLEHVHAIAGFPEQVKSVTDALAKWEFKPYIVNGQPVEIETGLLFQFPAAPRNGIPASNSGRRGTNTNFRETAFPSN